MKIRHSPSLLRELILVKADANHTYKAPAALGLIAELNRLE
jgi:hypothetical protein